MLDPPCSHSSISDLLSRLWQKSTVDSPPPSSSTSQCWYSQYRSLHHRYSFSSTWAFIFALCPRTQWSCLCNCYYQRTWDKWRGETLAPTTRSESRETLLFYPLTSYRQTWNSCHESPSSSRLLSFGYFPVRTFFCAEVECTPLGKRRKRCVIWTRSWWKRLGTTSSISYKCLDAPGSQACSLNAWRIQLTARA